MKKFLGFLVFVILAACGSAPKMGVVIDKRYVAAHTDTYTTNVCAMYDSNGICQVNIPQTHRDYVPEKYQIKLKSDDGKHEGWRTIDPETYQICESGMRYEKGVCFYFR